MTDLVTPLYMHCLVCPIISQVEIGSYFGNDGSIPVSTVPFTRHSGFSLTCFSIMQIMDEFNYINVNYVMISLKKKYEKGGP